MTLRQNFLRTFLGFPKKTDEYDFSRFHDADTAHLARIGIILSLVSWSAFGGLCYFLYPASYREITLLIGGILYTVFLLLIFSALARTWRGL